MLVTQFDKFVNRSTQEILGSQIERENLMPMLSTDIDPRLQNLKVTDNGIYYPDIGYNGFYEVDVDIPTNLQDIKITENGKYYPSEGYDGIYEVDVDIPTNLQNVTITENGKYYPSEGYDGIYEVDVNIPMGSAGVLNFDFTKSFTDTVKGYTASTSNVNITDNGATFQGTTGIIQIPSYAPLLTYEIEVGKLIRGSNHTRFLMYTYNSGFIYRNTGYWTFYRGTWDNVSISDFNYFNNSTVKLVVQSNYVWQIYKNDVLVLTSQGPCVYNDSTPRIFSIGSSDGDSLASGSTIKSLKVL